MLTPDHSISTAKISSIPNHLIGLLTILSRAEAATQQQSQKHHKLFFFLTSLLSGPHFTIPLVFDPPNYSHLSHHTATSKGQKTNCKTNKFSVQLLKERERGKNSETSKDSKLNFQELPVRWLLHTYSENPTCKVVFFRHICGYFV